MKHPNGSNGTQGLTFVGKPRRGHVQVFDGRRLRYLVTGYFNGDMSAARRIETLYGPTPAGVEYLRILRKADNAYEAAEHRRAA